MNFNSFGDGMRLEEMSWIDAKKAFLEKPVVLIPTGSTEQHGPHNPLGTDHFIAQEICRRTNYLVTPTIPIGVSKHHRQFPGTLWVESKVFKEYVLGICDSLRYHGVEKIVIVNGHGGNTQALIEVAMEMRERGVFVAIFEWWKALRLNAGHGGKEETSVNLFLYENLVKMERVEDGFKEWSPKKFGAIVNYDTIDFSKNGVVGKATKAEKKDGEKITKDAREMLGKLVDYLEKTSIKELLPKKKK